jgi:hypothetical protein
MALRAALACACALTVDVVSGATIPFLGALFAAQFLLSGLRPLPLGKAIGMVVLVLVVGQGILLVSEIFGDRPFQYLTLLGLFYFFLFTVHSSGSGGPAIIVCLIIAVMVPLLHLVHSDLDASMMGIFARAVIGGIVWSWVAHLLLPDAGTDDTVEAASAPVRPAIGRALASAVILIIAVGLCLTTTTLSGAIVVPVTVAALLLQLEAAATLRAAIGLVIINLIGGVVASLAFTVIELRPSIIMLFLISFLVALAFSANATGTTVMNKVYAGSLSTFLTLFGLGLSPLPTSTPESFSARLSLVLFAVVYSALMTALLWRNAPGRANA